MGTTVRLCPLKFSLRATVDHHGPPVHSDHYTASINCCKKHSIATITQLRSLELLIAKTPLLHCHTIWIDWHMSFGLEQEGGSLIAPMALAHPLHPIDNRSRNRRRNLWVGWCVSSWWLLFPSRSSVLIYIYVCICIYICILYEFCDRTYIYIQQECHSVLVKLHPITFYRTVSGECAVPGLNATFCFLWFTNCVLLSDK